MGTRDLYQVPPHQQRYDTGEPDKVQGRDRVEGSCGYWALGSVFGIHSRKPEYKTRMVGMWLNELKVQVRDLVRVLVLLPTLPNGDQYSEKVCIIEKPGVQD